MGKTILISSHILSELADCCTSIGIIERGQLLLHGPIDEVYRRIRRNRLVEIKFIDSLETGLSIIRSQPETRGVQVDDHRVTVELEADDQIVARLLGRTHQARRETAQLHRQRTYAGRRVYAGDQRAGELIQHNRSGRRVAVAAFPFAAHFAQAVDAQLEVVAQPLQHFAFVVGLAGRNCRWRCGRRACRARNSQRTDRCGGRACRAAMFQDTRRSKTSV